MVGSWACRSGSRSVKPQIRRFDPSHDHAVDGKHGVGDMEQRHGRENKTFIVGYKGLIRLLTTNL